MSDIYKLQYNGMTLAYPNWNGYVGCEVAQTFKTLTLCASDGGTLTAETLTGYPGDTVQLSPTYDTYWRFSGYDVHGDGSIADNTYTFGSEDEQIVSAYFKANAFTATGNFEAGSNTAISAKYNTHTTGNVPAKYAVHVSHTGDIPASWYSNSNRWNPTNASSYVINISPNMKFTCLATSTTAINRTCVGKYNITAQSLANNDVLNSTTITTALTSTKTAAASVEKYFTTTVSTNVQNYIMLSAKLSANNTYNSSWARAVLQYNATNNGSWSATGYAP